MENRTDIYKESPVEDEPLSFGAWTEQAAARLDARRAEKAAGEEAARAARSPWEVKRDEYIKRIVDEAPPLPPEMAAKIKMLLGGTPNPNPRPDVKPEPPRRGGRSVDPKRGTLYGTHLRASDGTCGRCGNAGHREVDHCHEHHVVRGPLCGRCNSMTEKNLGEDWRKNCLWCAWDIWLEKELAR